MKEKDRTNEKSNKGLSDFWNKTVDASKKALEQVKKNAHDKKVKKYNPLFPEDFKSSEFHIPNIIQIVDDAVRRDIDICEGAIGWVDRVGDVEVLHLYDEWVEESGIQFIPVWNCDSIYYVDNFNRNRYVNVNSVFSKTNEEKIAELENIAYCLGAKSCSVEIVVKDQEKAISKSKVQLEASVESIQEQSISKKDRAKTKVSFVGHNNPTYPKLKWFAHDDNIKGLIEKKCNDVQSVKSKILELSSACSATMNRKVACAIDKLLKVKGTASMEQQSIKEHSTTLIFELKF